MPNWCNNRLTVLGPEENVATFVEKANGPGQQYKISKQEQEYERQMRESNPDAWKAREERAKEIRPLSFHALVPIPAEILAQEYDPAGYEAEHALWGCKWGASKDMMVERSDGKAVYTFNTPWCSPRDFFARLARSWFPIVFIVSYGEEFPTRGRYVVRGGRCIQDLHEEPMVANGYNKGPCTCTTGDDCDVCRGHVAWREHWLKAHDEWANAVAESL